MAKKIQIKIITIVSIIYFTTSPHAQEFKEKCMKITSDLDQGIEACGLALKQEPSNDALLISRGTQYYLKNLNDLALSDFNEVIKKNQKNENALLGRANVYVSNKQYENALEDLSQVILRNPRSARAFAARCSIFGDLKQYEQALRDCTETVRLNPEFSSYFNRGRLFLLLAQYDLAIADYTEALKYYQKLSFVYVLRSNAWTEKKEYNKAIEDMNQAILLEKTAENYFVRGMIFLTINDLDRAIDDFSQAIKIDEKYVSAYSSRSETWEMKGNLQNAADDMTIAILMQPTTEKYHRRGIIFFKNGDFKNALIDFKQARKLDEKYRNTLMDALEARENKDFSTLRKICLENQNDKTTYACTVAIDSDPLDATVVLARAKSFSRANKNLLALKDYSLAIELSETNENKSDIHVQRGWFYFTRNDLNRALSDASTALDLSEKKHSGLFLRCNIYASSGELSAALKDCTEAIRYAPGEASYFNKRGDLYKALTQYDKALGDYTEAIKLDPEMTFAYISRSSIWADKKEYKKAISDLTEAMSSFIEIPEWYLTRGNLYFQIDDLDRAIADQNEAIRLKPSLADAYLYRGRSWYFKRNISKSIEDYNMAISLQPKEPIIYYLRGLAFAYKNELELALSDYRTFLSMAPDDMRAKEAVANIEKRIDDARKKGRKN